MSIRRLASLPVAAPWQSGYFTTEYSRLIASGSFMAKECLHALQSYFESLLDEDTKSRIQKIAQAQSNAFGVDPYGFDPNTLISVAPLLCWFYRHYFRVETYGADKIP